MPRGGKTTVDHPRNAHDDIANAVAGALVNTIPIGVAMFGFAEDTPGPGVTSTWDTSPIPEGIVDQFAYRFSRNYRGDRA